MVNREAIPLLVGISIPLILLALLVIQKTKYDFISLLSSIDVIYYIIIFPIALGLVFALLNRSKE